MLENNRRTEKRAHQKKGAKESQTKAVTLMEKYVETPKTAQPPKLYLKGLKKCHAFMTYYTSKQLYELHKKKKLKIPPIQRPEGQWKKDQDQALIKSMLKGFPIMPMLFQLADGILWVLDGQQRLYSERLFRENKLKISKSISEELEGMKWNELTPETQRSYNNMPIPAFVIQGKNGDATLTKKLGVEAYILEHSGLPLVAPQIRRAKFNDSAFHKLVMKVRNQMLQFYVSNGIVSKTSMLRSREEEIIAENILLVTSGVSDGRDIDKKYTERKTTAKLNSYLDGKDPIRLLQGYFGTINSMFNEFDKKGKCIGGGLKGTGFDNPNNFYGLLGAVKKALDEGIMPSNHKDVVQIGNKMKKLVLEVKTTLQDIRDNPSKVPPQVLKYHTTISRGTRDLQNREDRINILFDIIKRN
ncbi:MAG: DUF262 domain-containing protein [Patescibacteria group bacterium]|nr:DUF262 domain-containing protein [Patescibacteria group bacterium]